MPTPKHWKNSFSRLKFLLPLHRVCYSATAFLFPFRVNLLLQLHTWSLLQCQSVAIISFQNKISTPTRMYLPQIVSYMLKVLQHFSMFFPLSTTLFWLINSTTQNIQNLELHQKLLHVTIFKKCACTVCLSKLRGSARNVNFTPDFP